MKSIAETLSAAGQFISDEELILYILGGLSQEYDPVVVNLTSRYDTLTLQEVQFMLQSQEMRLEQLTSSVSIDLNNPSANLAAHLRRALNIWPPPGFTSQSPNSFSGRAPFNPRGRGRGRGRGGRGDGNRPVCQLCGRIGHITIKCYHRFDISFQGNQSSQTQAAFSTQP